MKSYDIKKLSELVRIKILPEEKDDIDRKISSVLDYSAQVQEISELIDATTDQENYRQINVMRKDEVVSSSQEEREMILQGFPESNKDYLLVKKVI